MRLYSIASARDGEKRNANNVGLTIKRVPGGVGSTYMCDLKIGDKVQVTGLRFLSSKNFTRVMLDLSQDAKYEVKRLKEDAAKGVPPRIYIDITAARLAMTLLSAALS